MLPGNCNHDNKDDFVARDIGLVDSVDAFGRSWLLEGEPSSCGIIKKEEMFCNLLPPEIDPCLSIMNEEIFGKVRTYQLFFSQILQGTALLILSASSSVLLLGAACYYLFYFVLPLLFDDTRIYTL